MFAKSVVITHHSKPSAVTGNVMHVQRLKTKPLSVPCNALKAVSTSNVSERMDLDAIMTYLDQVGKLVEGLEQLSVALDVVTEKALAQMPVNPNIPLQ